MIREWMTCGEAAGYVNRTKTMVETLGRGGKVARRKDKRKGVYLYRTKDLSRLYPAEAAKSVAAETTTMPVVIALDNDPYLTNFTGDKHPAEAKLDEVTGLIKWILSGVDGGHICQGEAIEKIKTALL